MISLLLLTIMSLLGLGAMQGALLEEKMASNYRFSQLAFHAAESGLQQAITNHANNQISSPLSGSVGQSDYSVTIVESADLYTVTSQATHSASGAQQQLTLQLSGAPGATPTLEQWSADE